MPETIQEKADRLIGSNRRDLVGLLRAIADGEWTPEDARELKAAQEAGKVTQ